MIRVAVCLWFGALLLPTISQAASQTFEAMVIAQSGEQEAAACARARQDLHRQSVDFLVGKSADLRSYHQLLDAYTWQGRSRADLDQDIGAQLADVDITEVSRFWSGKSCLLRGYVELDPVPILEQMISAMPEAQPRSSQSDDQTSWFDMPGIAIDKIRNQKILVDAVTELSAVRMMVAERWASTNRWPRSLSEINLDVRDFEKSEVIDQVVMGDGGAIQARLKSPLGGETVVFTPEMGAMEIIRWSCTTTVPVLFNGTCPD